MNAMRENVPELSVDLAKETVVVLGIASIDTLGGPMAGEEMGGFAVLGIVQD